MNAGHEDASPQSGDDRQDLERRMEEIRQQVVADVEKNWGSMWRSDEMVEAKVSARLSGHEEYQDLLRRLREDDSRNGG